MAVCEVCGNDYYLAFEVITAGNRHVFDCFECAIHRLAPVCAHCSCKIIGHGIEAKETFFCCATALNNPAFRELPTIFGVRKKRQPIKSKISKVAQKQFWKTNFPGKSENLPDFFDNLQPLRQSKNQTAFSSRKHIKF